jgi:hypothetical protein
VTRNQSLRGENAANQPKILPAILAKIIDWLGFPGNVRDGLLIRRSLVRAQVGEPIFQTKGSST